MQITKASDAVGAQVSDVDLNLLSDDQFAELKSAFFDHGVLFFHEQDLTPEQHIAFAERWGEINVNRFFAAAEDYPQIATVTKEPDQTVNIGGGWHTDHSYDQIPAMGSILYALETPPTGGDTLFAGMQAAYDGLSDAMKDRIDGLYGEHGSEHIFGKQSDHAGEIGERFGNAEAATQKAVHPIALPHPETGKKGIYVNPAFTTGIQGMEAKEAGALLGELYEHCMKPEYHYRFQWGNGSMAMWDNRSTWHYALNDYHGHRRHMHRITLEGCALQ